jgi:uncharacterized membrane protein
MKKKNEIKPLSFHPLSVDHVKEINSERATFAEKAADFLSDWMGSWKFINLTLLVFACWFGINIFTPFKFDPVPFLILNLSIGVISTLQTPVIMLGQKSIDRKNQIKQEIHFNKIEDLEQKNELMSRKLDEINKKLDSLVNQNEEKN